MSPLQNQKKVGYIILVEGVINFLVLLAKLAVGLHSGSNAILSDAVHSLADLSNNIFVFFVSKLSSSPPDSNHPYGHRKFETLAVFLLAVLLCLIAIEISIRAVNTSGSSVQSTPWDLVAMASVLTLNIFLAGWEHFWSKRLNSNLLRADAQHTLSDVFTTVAVVIGWQLSVYGYPILDTVFTLSVSALVLYLAYDLFRRAIPILVDQAGVEPKLLIDKIRSVTGVLGVRRIRSRYVESEIIADMVVTVDAQISTEESHRIADEIEKTLAESFGIFDVTIHIEPEKKD